MSFSALLQTQRAFFETGVTRDLSFRRNQLRKLRDICKKNEEKIFEALKSDLRKPRLEAYAGELAPFFDEIDLAILHLPLWMKRRQVKTQFYKLGHLFAESFILPEPLGVTLILGPWNYPFNLILLPLIGAIAAGNCVVIKPSEMAPTSSTLLFQLISENFDPHYIKVVEGDASVSKDLVSERWDKIFFTGGTEIGKQIMKSAAEFLTPITLELGGKSPCFIDHEVDIKIAARRIIWGKFFNAGQTCVAPDYLLVHKDLKSKFIDQLKTTLQEFYGSNPQTSSDYARVINEKHFDRLTSYLSFGKIASGGRSDKTDLYIEPTLIECDSNTPKLMEDEIFGPILPIVTYSHLLEAVTLIKSKAKPLAFYIFTSNKKTEEFLLQQIAAGGVCINDTLVHLTNAELPFGGVGPSGLGRYHGEYSFNEFSHFKAVEKKSFSFDSRFRYAPYKFALKSGLLTKIIKKFI
ncbi:MAG: aldehyde dehydrogenase family protein [Deltaproteobacteria bacterium]|nr:aldehyde dehydrogenase family protein [Deltaproteobacteria bacterium]